MTTYQKNKDCRWFQAHPQAASAIAHSHPQAAALPSEFPHQAVSALPKTAQLEEIVRELVALFTEEIRATLLNSLSVAALTLSSKTNLNDLATSAILKNGTDLGINY